MLTSRCPLERLPRTSSAVLAIALVTGLLSPLSIRARPSPDDGAAAEKNDPTRATPFTLRDLEGHETSLVLGDRTGLTVLAWNGVGCPISELSAKRLVALAREFDPRGVRFLGVNSSWHDTVPELRAYRQRHELPFPVLKDHDGAVARQLAVERTTEVLLLDRALEIRYRGSLDDLHSITDRSVGFRKDRVEESYLRDAIESVLEGKPVAKPRTDAAGCIIGRRPKSDSTAEELSYHRDIEPIVVKRCQPCHRPGEIGPFALLEYDDVAGWSGMIREVVENRRMPPWHANPEYGVFANDRSLTAEERASVLAWIDAGSPRGDPKDAPTHPERTEGWSLGTPDAQFEMPVEYEVRAEGSIPYQYFVVPTELAEDRWVRAIEVRAGARSVVHHILVFAVDPENPRQWRRETGGGTRGYFGVMVPGEEPTVFPAGAAKRLPANASLVFQIHYTPTGEPTRDRSRVGLWFADEDTVQHEIRTRSAINTRLSIPANTERVVEEAEYRLREDLVVLQLLPHMHLRGSAFRYEALLPVSVALSRGPAWEKLSRKSMERLSYRDGKLTSVGAIPPDAATELLAQYEGAEREQVAKWIGRTRTEVLLDVPAYDFGWQSSYRFVEPRRLPAGTVLRCTAVFNNSSSNPALSQRMWSRRVRWGDQTDEEMLIGYFDAYAPGD